jgi:uncharacterized protein (UPF0332 family)
MAISAQDLIDLASSMANAGASEAELRAAISRAYYAAFHALVPFAGRLPKSRVCPDGLDRVNHRELRERLTEWRTDGVSARLKAMTATKSTLSRTVEAACNARVVSDYRMGSDVSLAEAQTQVARVKCILRQVRQIQAEIDRDKSGGSIASGIG